jgi:hypothetical protein
MPVTGMMEGWRIIVPVTSIYFGGKKILHFERILPSM